MDADAVNNAGLVAGGAPENAAAENANDNAPDAPGVNVDDADVGILGADASSSEDEDEEDAPTDLHDVWEALNHATLTGSFAASDIADGSTLTPALPNPGLKINGVGDIPLPLSDWHAKAIKTNRHTAKIQDGSYHKVHSVEPRRLRFENPAWEAKFASLLQTVAYRLGVDPDKLSTKLDMLLLMEKGSQIKRCSNVEEDDSVIGTLLVQLPSRFKGGEVTVYNVDGEEEEDGHGEDGEDEEEEEHGEDDEEYEYEDEVKTFDMGASGEGSFSCHFVCHYKDCEFEIEKVVSGHRALLRYSLRYEGESEIPSANALVSSLSTLKWSLTALPPSDRILLIPLAKKYSAVDVGRHGVNVLSHEHRSRFEAIKVSAGEGWKVLLVKAKQNHTRKYDDYYGQIETISTNRSFSVLNIFDEDGHDVTTSEKWLKSVIKLTPIDVKSGMLLNAKNAYKESWGRRCSSATETADYDGIKTTTSSFIATFILAYDATLVDAELKCLRGCEGVAEVTDSVVAKRDYLMLERVLSVVDSKEKAKFDLSSCKKVLQMLNRSRSKNALSSERIDFVRKTLSGLDSSEPDAELYDAIRAAACKFGYENVEAQIANLLSDVDRRKELELHQFLLRCDFILKISKGHENNWLETLCRALPRCGAHKIEDSCAINSTIDSLVSEHGWEAVAVVVEATLRFMHSKTATNSTVSKLLDRARLLQKASGHQSGFVQSCLVDFAKDFADCLGSCEAHVAKPHLRGENKQIFAKAICYVMEYGVEVDLDRLGRWSIADQDLFPLVLEVILEQAGALGFEARGLIHEMLNRCLLQNSCSGRYGWRSHRGADEKVPPSLHVRKVIADYPDMTRTPGGDGRLTLHCAVANKMTPFDTVVDVFESYPQAASICCPVSGIYPFMLAASNCPPPPREGASSYIRRKDMDCSMGMIGASFRLLLADPSLVAGGIPVDDEGSRKRKRSASMDGQ